MRTITDCDLKGKRVLIRTDFNVPLNDAREITDDNRIKQSLPTIEHVLDQQAFPVVMSHLGRPGGEKKSEYSLKPVAAHLEKLLAKRNVKVIFAKDCVGSEVQAQAAALTENQVLLLENLRFHKGEEANDPEFARALAKNGEVYLNDAFATAHRAHASTEGITHHVEEAAAGLLMQKELNYYHRTLLSPQRPLCVILGGAKVSTKLKTLRHLSDLADKLIIGGAMANTFLAAQGIQMGRSLYEPELFPAVVELLGSLARKGCALYLPVDFRVGSSPKSDSPARCVTAQEVPPEQMALDIGPATSILFDEAIRTSETIIWNGPMGLFENEVYSKGTSDLITSLGSALGLTVAGGGDTDAAIHQMELAHKFDYISTGGGAFLELLEGKTLPGIAALS